MSDGVMFRNKKMTAVVGYTPKHGMVGWKSVGDQPTEHIFTTTSGWVCTPDYRRLRSEKKARNIAHYRMYPALLAQKIAEKSGSRRLLRRAYTHGSAW
jgi:hypothetical protein